MASRVRGLALVALLLPLTLAGCSGTRFGDALSRSFSKAPAAPAGGPQPSAAGAPAGGTAVGLDPGATTSSGKGAAKPPANGLTSGAGKTPAGAQPAPAAQSPSPVPAAPLSGASSPAAAPPRRPAPYRVTILLPQADASAPAEVVTQALRAAGVPFEVETIERIGSSPVAPGTVPPAPQAAPTVRPAPPPR